MSYIGSSAAPVPVAFSGVRTQSFSGNGSTSLFTLNRAVSAVTAIEVVVNNVQQSPFDGSYSIVNNGVGLQFSENVSAGTNNIYVTYRDQAIGSLYDTGAVRKAGDVMSGSLSINGAASSTSLVIGRGDTSLEGGQLDLCRASDNVAAWGIDVYGAGNTPVLRVIDNVAGAVRLQIDSVGRVTMPNQPAFEVRPGTSITLPAASDTKVTFTDVRFNRGSHYNSGTGRFTAPVAGLYAFFVFGSVYSGGTDQYLTSHLKKNGSDITGYARGATSGGQYESTPISIVVPLNASDYIELFSYSQNGSAYWLGSEGSFSGYLIG